MAKLIMSDKNRRPFLKIPENGLAVELQNVHHNFSRRQQHMRLSKTNIVATCPLVSQTHKLSCQTHKLDGGLKDYIRNFKK